MRLVLAVALTVAGACAAQAQPVAKSAGATGAFPARPMRLLLGYTPGGTTDYVARTIAQHAHVIFFAAGMSGIACLRA